MKKWALCAAFSALFGTAIAGTTTDNMIVQDNAQAASQVTLNLLTQADKAPMIQLKLGAPAEVLLTHGDHVLFNKHLPAGNSNIDTSKFPAGQYEILVTVKQPGVTFMMRQSVLITKAEKSAS